MAEVDLQSLSAEKAYGLLMAMIVPRPIAFVTTIDVHGIVNAAPFSSLVALSPAPPLVGFVVGGWEGGRKRTLVNIEASGEFVVNVVTTEIAEAVQRCTDPALSGVDKLAAVGLACARSTVVAPPRVAVSPMSMECRLEKIVPFGDAPDQLVAGRIVRIHVADSLLHEGRIMQGAWHAVGRIGGRSYCHVREFFEA